MARRAERKEFFDKRGPAKRIKKSGDGNPQGSEDVGTNWGLY